MGSSFVSLFLNSVILSTFANDSASTPVANYEVCESPQCKEIAIQLKNSMNESVNPCDNFYEYMCGGFIKNNQIPKNHDKITQEMKNEETTILRLREILDSPAGENDTKSLKHSKKLYKMCQDTETIKSLGISPLVNFINKIGGWPIAESSVNKSVSWQEFFKMRNVISMPYEIVGIHVEPDIEKSDSNLIWLGRPKLFLSSEKYQNPEKHKDKFDAYRDLITDVVELFVNATGTSVSEESIRKDVEDIIQLETKLMNISQMNGEQMKFVNLFDVTIDELQQKYDSQKQLTDVSKIDWLSMIQHYSLSANISINGSEKVFLGAPKFILQLPKILDETSHRTIVNFMQWQLIRNLLYYFDDNSGENLSSYKKKVYSFKPQEKRWEKCMRSSHFEIALYNEYVRKYFPSSAEQEVNIIVAGIKNVIKEEISQTKWMDENTKDIAIDLLKYIDNLIRRPKLFSATAIDLYYDADGVNITSNYFESQINVIAHQAILQLRTLREPVKNIDESPTFVEGKSFYSTSKNKMLLAAKYLGEPIFDLLRPSAINYGVYGTIIGQQSSLEFTLPGLMGRRYWELERISDTKKKYNDIRNCFIDQYNQYIIPELLEINKTVHLKGDLTAENSISDFEGVAVSYAAFKERFDYSKEKEIKLPGFEGFSADQMFFMSMANTFCEKTTLAALEEESTNYSNTPKRLRIRGALSNFQKFADTFNCPLGSPMNPPKKCSLWK